MAKKRRGRSAAFMRSINPFLNKRSRSTKRGAKQMAKRRSRRTRSKGSGSVGVGVKGLLGAAVYGAVRGRVSEALTPVTNKIPMGNISDEVGILALSWFAAKKFPMSRPLAIPAMFIEAARIGEAMSDGAVFPSGSSSSGSIPQTVIA